MLYQKRELENAFVFDLETIAQYPAFNDFNAKEPDKADIWLRKNHFKSLERELKFLNEMFILTRDDEYSNICHLLTSDNPDNLEWAQNYIYIKYAALYAEFGKVLVMSVGMFNDNLQIDKDSIDSIAFDDEAELLKAASKMLEKAFKFVLAGYNIIQYDIPFLVKRLLIHKMKIPPILNFRGKKPWEINVTDVMKDYQGVSYEPVTLDLLCNTFGVKSPKDLIQNYQVSLKYHSKEASLQDIVVYCEKDVKALMELMVVLCQ